MPEKLFPCSRGLAVELDGDSKLGLSDEKSCDASSSMQHGWMLVCSLTAAGTASYMCAMAKAVLLEQLRQRSRCACLCPLSGILPVIT